MWLNPCQLPFLPSLQSEVINSEASWCPLIKVLLITCEHISTQRCMLSKSVPAIQRYSLSLLFLKVYSHDFLPYHLPLILPSSPTLFTVSQVLCDVNTYYNLRYVFKQNGWMGNTCILPIGKISSYVSSFRVTSSRVRLQYKFVYSHGPQNHLILLVSFLL